MYELHITGLYLNTAFYTTLSAAIRCTAVAVIPAGMQGCTMPWMQIAAVGRPSQGVVIAYLFPAALKKCPLKHGSLPSFLWKMKLIEFY